MTVWNANAKWCDSAGSDARNRINGRRVLKVRKGEEGGASQPSGSGGSTCVKVRGVG